MNETAEYPKRRSGAYPYISLPEALDRLGEMFKKDGLNFVPMRLMHERWGYNPLSSSLKLTVAALGYYGLIDDEGSGDDRKIRINGIGHKIIKQAPGYDELIKSAAIKPKIFNEIWTHYRATGLPQNDVIQNYLVWELGGYTDKAATHIVNKFKETIDFANLEFNDVLDEDIQEEQENVMISQGVAKDKPSAASNMSTVHSFGQFESNELEGYNIPLIGKKNATIFIPRPLSLDNYELIKSWLNHMKNALIIQENEGKQENKTKIDDATKITDPE